MCLVCQTETISISDYHFVVMIMQRLFQIPCLYLPQYPNHCHYCGQIVGCEVEPALFARMDGKWAVGGSRTSSHGEYI